MFFSLDLLHVRLPRRICSPLAKYALPALEMRRTYLPSAETCTGSTHPAAKDASDLLVTPSISRLQLTLLGRRKGTEEEEFQPSFYPFFFFKKTSMGMKPYLEMEERD